MTEKEIMTKENSKATTPNALSEVVIPVKFNKEIKNLTVEEASLLAQKGMKFDLIKDDFEKINYELKNFSEEIAQRPQIVVMNKTDLATEEQIEEFKTYIEELGLPCFSCSAATTKGTNEVVEYIAGELDKLPPPIRFEAQPLTREELDEQELRKKTFTISKEDGIFIVDAPFIVPILQMVDMEDYESLQYFQRVLRFSGIIDKKAIRYIRIIITINNIITRIILKCASGDNKSTSRDYSPILCRIINKMTIH